MNNESADAGIDTRSTTAVGRTRNDGLRSAAVKGAAWSYASFVTVRIPALVTTIALTRLIAPEDFGVIAIGLMILAYLDSLNDFGIGSEVIYSSYDGERDRSVTFWLSMATGVLAALVMSALAYPLAAAFREPRLHTVVPALSLAFVLNSLGSVHIAAMKKQLQFRQLVSVDIARSFLKAAVSIAGAFAGWGVWCLVAGQLAGELAASVAVWIKLRWRPRMAWDWSIVRRVFSYGGHIMGLGFISVVLSDIDYIIVGRRLGATALGFYSVGFRLPQLAVLGICYSVSASMFPVLTKIRDDHEAMAQAVAKSLRMLVLLTVPIGVGIALTSRDFVSTFYGDRWGPTGQVMPLIALYAVVFSMTYVVGDVYKAVGRPGILTAMAGARLPIAIVTLVAVVSHGIVWVAGAQLAIITTNLLLQIFIAHRVLHLSMKVFVHATRSALIAGLAMVSTVAAVEHIFVGFSPPTRFALSVVNGAVAYLAVALVLERSLITEVAGGLRSRMAGAV
jgi:PST family polysaccharide transporter